jgi:hypothetical protein
MNDAPPRQSNTVAGRLRLLEWRPLRQNTLRGFATIRIDPPGLVIHELPIHRNNERSYALMPGKPQIGTDGHVLTDERGKRKYVPVVEIPDRDVRDRISAGVVRLVRQRDHAALA